MSTKSITRWRKAGLRWRWVRPAEGRRRVVVCTESAVEHFLAGAADQVARAARFTQMDDALRRRLLARARRLATARDVSLNQVAQHLARRTGRAVQTIRQLLEKHDHAQPEQPIFADRSGPLSMHDQRLIARAYRLGVPVARLAERFDRTRVTIYRIIHQRRAAALRGRPIHFLPSPLFKRFDAAELIGQPEAQLPAAAGGAEAAPTADLPASLAVLYHHPPLPAELQQALVVRYNYLKYRAAALRDALDPYAPRGSDLDRIETWLRQAALVRDRLIAVNLPVVLTSARRQLVAEQDRSTTRLLVLLEDGQRVLYQALEEYDPAKGGELETYLSWRLARHFATGATGRSDRARRRSDPADVLARMRADAASADVRLPGQNDV